MESASYKRLREQQQNLLCITQERHSAHVKVGWREMEFFKRGQGVDTVLLQNI